MAAIYVQSKISLHCLVTEKRITTDAPPNDGDQFNDIWHCVTKKIDRNEWRWRYETAKDILCQGYADTTGYYLGDVLGGRYV
jgi:hypothetical protein